MRVRIDIALDVDREHWDQLTEFGSESEARHAVRRWVWDRIFADGAPGVEIVRKPWE